MDEILLMVDSEIALAVVRKQYMYHSDILFVEMQIYFK